MTLKANFDVAESARLLDFLRSSYVAVERSLKVRTFENVYISEADFEKDWISNITVNKGLFEKCDFSKADIDLSSFSECEFIQCDFTQAVMENCRFHKCHFDKCVMSGTSIKQTAILESEISASQLSCSIFFGGRFSSTIITSSNAIRTAFRATSFDDLKFASCNLTGLSIETTKTLLGVGFKNCILSEAKLEERIKNIGSFSEIIIEPTLFKYITPRSSTRPIEIKKAESKKAVIYSSKIDDLLEMTNEG